eukprot:Seg2456.4 transcript_id=Seg2456.4/GoldUCD/mRNA.D3Y31 product="hypothetical protein" protein_id=Seg2456.4/GoldUCD/D3Y31
MKNAALRSFASRRNIKSILATGDARSFLDNTLGKKKGGHFLIKVDDVKILIEEKRRLAKSANIPKEETVIKSEKNLPTTCEKKLPILVHTKLTQDCNGETSMQSLPSTSTESPQIDATTATSGKPDGPSANVSFQRERSTVVKNMQRRRLPLVLNESQLKDFSKFYSAVLNPIRPSLHMSTETVKRHEKRVREFMDYIERKYERPASFDDCLDIGIATLYIDERTGAMSKGTSATHVQTLIVLAKYVLRDSKHRGSWERVKEVADPRHLQNQLQCGYERDRRKVDPRKDKRRCFEWEQVMETLRLMREKLELHSEEGKGKDRPRLYHDFTILLLFSTLNPNRNMDFSKLRIANAGKEPVNDPYEEDSNWMIFNEDGTTELVVYQFKTNRQYGANRIKVSDYDFVDSHVKAFIKKERKKLLQGTSHDFLFMQSNGEPFDSTGGFCKYMQATFKKYNGGNSLYSTNEGAAERAAERDVEPMMSEGKPFDERQSVNNQSTCQPSTTKKANKATANKSRYLEIKSEGLRES